LSEESITAAISGDVAAFEAVVRAYDDSLRILAYRLVGDSASDALQDAYVRAYAAIQRFDYRGDGGSALRTWLHRIVYRVCMDYLRQDSRHAELIGRSEPANVATAATDDIAISSVAVAHALSGLGADSRTVLVLVEILGLDYREAAEVIGISPGTLASRLHAARKRLRWELRDYKET
jgi:RNA polymerase sigma-70 factor (ECF subfamily)